MQKAVKALTPVLLLGAAIYCFRESYEAYASQQLSLYLNDPSGAELYELNFQLFTPPAIILAAIGCFLAGRWWFR